MNTLNIDTHTQESAWKHKKYGHIIVYISDIMGPIECASTN